MMCVSARPRESRVQTVILGQKRAGRCRRRSLVPHLLAPVAFAEYHPDTRSSGTYQYYILPRRPARGALLPAARRPDARHPGTLDYLEEYVWPNCSRTTV